MRPFLAIAITVLLIGATYAYHQFNQSLRRQILAQRDATAFDRPAPGAFNLRLVCTFDAAAGEFGEPAVLVKFQDRVLLQRTEPLAAGQIVQVENVEGIERGKNDFFIQIHPAKTSGLDPEMDEREGQVTAADHDILSPVENGVSMEYRLSSPMARSSSMRSAHASPVARAVRVLVERDGNLLTETILWSETEGSVSGLVAFEVPISLPIAVGENGAEDRP